MRGGSDSWATPQAFFELLDAEFGFTVDAAASIENAKCERFYSESNSGLSASWSGEIVWLNPPFSALDLWVRKAFEEGRSGATVVCLVPVRSGVGWWHDYAMKASEIRFVRGRLQFNDCGVGAPFDCAVLVFRPQISSIHARVTGTRATHSEDL